MPRALAVPIRQKILARHQQGQNATTIAEQMQLHLRTVQNLVKRFHNNPQALAPTYRTRPRPQHPLHEAALQCRRDHPRWGAQMIQLHLQQSQPQDEHTKEPNPHRAEQADLPSVRT
jgi:transposase